MTIKLDLQQNTTQDELFDMSLVSRSVVIDCMNEVTAELQSVKLLLMEANSASIEYMRQLRLLRAQLADLYTLL